MGDGGVEAARPPAAHAVTLPHDPALPQVLGLSVASDGSVSVVWNTTVGSSTFSVGTLLLAGDEVVVEVGGVRMGRWWA